MYEFKLPDLGEGIHEAEILKWHVGPGDRIAADQPLVDVETDKAAVTIPSPRAGTIVRVEGRPGDTVTVGKVIAVIDDGAPAEARPATAQAAAVAITPPAGPREPAVRPATGQRPPAAPATRRLARELGVDLARVAPTGPAGRVTPDDVRRAAGPHPRPLSDAAERGDAAPGTDLPLSTKLERGSGGEAAPAAIPFLEREPMPEFERFGPVEREPLRSIRRKIARKMVTSMALVPHVVHMDEADVTELDAFRRRYADRHPEGPRPSLLAFAVKAVTAALERARMFNASLDPDTEEIVYKRYYNIGLAADTPRGLIVPVVKAADRKSVLEIAAEIEALAGRARSGALELEALQGGTFTITNIGPLGGIALVPAINYPEVAILGMGRADPKPVVRDGEIVVRTMLPLTLSFDHRVADGADAARFVTDVVRLLSDPDTLLLEG